MKKRILQINSDANWGSHGRIAEEIGQLMMSKGWESYIAFGRDVNPSQSNLIKVGTRASNCLHFLETRLLDNHGLSSRKATELFINQICELKPDLIHLHNIHGYYVNYKILFNGIKEIGCPVVWTFHDCWPFTGHCTYPVYTECEKWKEKCFKCSQTDYYPKSFIDRSESNFRKKKEIFLGLQNLHIVTVSDWLKNEVNQSFFKGKDIRRIYNGIDVDIFKPTQRSIIREKYNLTRKNIIILGVASIWDERKGLYDFLKLKELLPANYRIILVGLNKNQASKISSDIYTIERTDNIEELVDLYSEADVFVNPSLAETFGMTTAEALSCGTPAVVYNTTACPELVDDNTGSVVKTGNIEEMANSIIKLSSVNKTDISMRCRERAVSLFSKKDRYQEYLNLYNELI